MLRAAKFFVIGLAVLSLGLFLKASIPQVATGIWSSAGNMSVARAGAASVLLPDGRIMIIGGSDANGIPLASAEFFNMDGTFVKGPSMSVARSGHAAIWLLNGEVLVTGGISAAGGSANNSAEVFDPLNPQTGWTSLAPMPNARTGHTMTALPDGSVLLAGGENNLGPVAALDVLEIAPTEHFVAAGTLLTARKAQAAAALNDGRVLIAGGVDVNGFTLASTEIFNPAALTDTTVPLVTAGPALKTARSSASAITLLDGTVLIAGGSYPEDVSQINPDGTTTQTGPAELSTAEVFDPAASAFAAAPSAMTTARSGHQAFLLPNNNNVLLVGGSYNKHPLASSELYTPWTGQFQSTGDMAAGRSAATGAAMNNPSSSYPVSGTDGLLMIAGGDAQQSTELYGFATVKTDKTDYAPGEVVTITGAGWQPGEPVMLSFRESSGIDTPGPFTVTADASGHILDTEFAPDAQDIGVRFFVIALAPNSGLQAQNTFTDGNVTVSGTVTNSATGNPISGATVTCDTSSGCNSSFTVTTAADGSYSFDAKGGSGHGPKLAFNGSGPATLTLTASAPSFTSATQTLVNVHNGDTPTGVNFTLMPAIATTTIAASNASATFSSSDQTLPLSATVTSSSTVNGGTVTFTIKNSGNGTIGSPVTSGTVTGGNASASFTLPGGTPAGSYTINAAYSGATGLAASNDNTHTLTVSIATQTITFNAPTTATYGDAAITLSATGGASGNPVTFASTTPIICTTGGTNGSTLTIVAAGTCSVTASQAGNTNYSAATDVTKSITINKATPIVNVSGGPFTYDGLAHAAAVAVTGVGGAAVSGTPAITYTPPGNTTAPVDASTYTVGVSFTSADSNYTDATGSGSIVINKADSATTVTIAGGASFTYDGNAHPATVTVTGAGGLNLTPDPVYSCGHTPTNVADSGCSASYNFAGDNNHNPSSDSKTYAIAKAASTTTITIAGGESFTYDGLAHPASLTVTGAGGLNLTPDPVYSCGHPPVNVVDSGCTASYNYAGDANHNPSSDSKIYTIKKAPSTTTVNVVGGVSFTFDGNAHPATVTVTGAGGLNLTPDPVYSCGHSPINVADSGCTASYTFAGDPNHDGSSGSKTYTIIKADTTTTVSGGGTFMYDGNPHAATATVTGGGGLSLNPSPTYSCGTAPINVADTPCTASYAYPGDANHNGSNGSAVITITKADSVTAVSGGGTFVYDGNPHAAAVTVTGAGGLSLNPSPNYSCGGAPIDVPSTPCTASYTFAGDANHNGSSGNTVITITKASSTTIVTVAGGENFTYDGVARPATVTVTGVGGLSLNPSPSYSCGHVPINVIDTGCVASYAYAGDINHNSSADAKTYTIAKAPSVTTITTGYTAIYDGLPHGVTASVTGVGGLNQPVPVIYNPPGTTTVPVNPGTYNATASFAGDANHLGSSAGPVSVTIGYGTCNPAIGPGGVILPPINSNGSSVYSRKGGSTIPVKFRVCDASGNSISIPAAAFAPSGGSLTMLSAVRGTIDDVNEATTTDIPDVAFRWDVSGQQWVFNMATTNLTSGGTYAFRVNLALGNITFVVGVR